MAPTLWWTATIVISGVATRRPLWNPILDGRHPKRCPHETELAVFVTLDPFSMTEFIGTRLKGGAGHRGSLFEWP